MKKHINQTMMLSLLQFIFVFILSLIMEQGEIALLNAGIGSIITASGLTILSYANLRVEFNTISKYQEACKNGNLNLVRQLVEYELEEIELMDLRKMVAEGFNNACENGHIDVVRYLMTRRILGANMHIYAVALFRSSCMDENVQIIKTLLQIESIRSLAHEAFEIRGIEQVQTPLSRAASIGFRCNLSKRIEIIKLLLTVRRVRETAHSYGNLALSNAACWNDGALIVKNLLEVASIRDTAHLIDEDSRAPNAVRMACLFEPKIHVLRELLKVERIRVSSIPFLSAKLAYYQMNTVLRQSLVKLMQISYIYQIATVEQKELFRISADVAWTSLPHSEMSLYLKNSIRRAVFFIKRVYLVSPQVKNLKRSWLYACQFLSSDMNKSEKLSLPKAVWIKIMAMVCNLEDISNGYIISLLTVTSGDLKLKLKILGCEDNFGEARRDQDEVITRTISSPVRAVTRLEPSRSKSL